MSSIIQVTGPLAGTFAPGHLELTIEHIVLSLGTNTDASPAAAASPGKKRKYAAVPTATASLPIPTAVEATAQGLTAAASTSTRPMTVVDNAAALSEASLDPVAEETSPTPPTASTRNSKYRGKGKATKDA